jgi:hypothetical protein
MLCSVLIPTRHRADRLAAAVESVFRTAVSPQSVEVILCVHADDTETVTALPSLLLMGNVRAFIGPPAPYDKNGEIHWELCQLAKGAWLWFFNDDVTVDQCSLGWDDCLQDMPTGGVIALPDTHRLGESIYTRDEKCPFMFTPNGWWKRLGLTGFVSPIDNFVFGTLRVANAWKTEFIPGLSVWHDRRNDRLMQEEGQRF